MRVHAILNGTAIRFIQAEPGRPPRSPIPLIRALEDRYGFVQVPRKLEEFNFTNGVTFLQGYFNGTIIKKFQIFEVGLLCEINEDNEIGDRFFDDLLSWLPKQYDIPLKETGVRAYTSQLEVVAKFDLGRKLAVFSKIGTEISSYLSTCGLKTPDYATSGFKLHYDAVDLHGTFSPEFAFERRTGQSYQSNIYFTSAPLKMVDHLKILQMIEDLFT